MNELIVFYQTAPLLPLRDTICIGKFGIIDNQFRLLTLAALSLKILPILYLWWLNNSWLSSYNFSIMSDFSVDCN